MDLAETEIPKWAFQYLKGGQFSSKTIVINEGLTFIPEHKCWHRLADPKQLRYTRMPTSRSQHHQDLRWSDTTCLMALNVDKSLRHALGSTGNQHDQRKGIVTHIQS